MLELHEVVEEVLQSSILVASYTRTVEDRVRWIFEKFYHSSEALLFGEVFPGPTFCIVEDRPSFYYST